MATAQPKPAAHHALPDGFADKLNRIASHAERLPLTRDWEDFMRSCAAISNSLRNLAEFGGQ